MVRLVSLSSVLAVVALGPQAVLGSFSFKLSPVVQCEPVNITFSGTSHNRSVPTTLTIIPLADNATPIKIPVPDGSSNTTGIQLSFIPLPVDTQFIASLDNIQGSMSFMRVSDVIRVGPPADPSLLNGACLGSPPIPRADFYTFNDDVSQCESFTVTYNTTFPPTITAFMPKGRSFPITQNDSNPTPGTATFMMSVNRNTQLSLFFDDGEGNLQTTKLMTVGGDTSSSKTCIKPMSMDMMMNPQTMLANQKSSGVPKGAIIGITVGAIALVLLIVLILLYLLRQRRRNRRASDMRFDPAMLNKRWSPSDDVEKKVDLVQSPPTTSYLAGEFVRDPVYTNEKYAASIVSADAQSIGSWNEFIPQEQQRAIPVPPVPSTTLLSPKQARRPSVTSSRISMATVDIQNILQMATVHRDGSSQGRPSPKSPTFDISRLPAARLRGDPVSRNNSATAAAMSGVPSPYMNPPYVSSFDDSDDEDEGAPPPQPLAPNRRARSRDEGGIGGYPVPRQPRSPESFGNLNA